MAMVGDVVVGKLFEALYKGVEDLIGKNIIFRKLFIDLKSALDRLTPLIEEMMKYNQQLNRTTKELEDIEGLIKVGIELVGKCSKIRTWWDAYKKYKYARKFLEFEKSLQHQLEILKVQVARDVKKTEVAVESIQVTVQTIQEELVKQKLSSEVEGLRAVLPELPALTVGLEAPLNELKARLLQEGASMLIVTAPGGCGKTTLATKFCHDQQAKDMFKNNIFFVTFSKKPNLEVIMTELYKQRGSAVPSFHNGVHPRKWLEQIKMDKGDDPLLLVLDDVWSGSQSHLEKFEFKMSNYKVLVTSRSEFPRFGSSYRLPLLDDHNATELFRHTASLEDKSSHIPKDLSKKIIEHCNGFPLAIIVAGRSLCGQPLVTWQSRDIEMSKGSSILDFETELLLCLQRSIDALENEMHMVKECFLDLGAFPEDVQIQVTALIDMWAELYDLDEEASCISKLYELNNRSLANLIHKPRWLIRQESPEVVMDYGEYTVRQHDLLRELAIYNSKLDCLERRERLIIEIRGNNLPKWWRDQKYQNINARLVSISTDREFSVKWPDMRLPEAEVLVLNIRSRSYALPEFVEKMDKLKLLVIISYSGYFTEMDNFQLLSSLSNLRSIRLDGVNAACITKSSVQLRNLHKLHLRFFDNFDFHGPGKLSHAFPNLKEMVLENYSLSIHEWLAAEICELIHLRKLEIIVGLFLCRRELLTEVIGTQVNLEVLRIFYCDFSNLPDSIRNLTKLRFLEFSHNEFITKLPEHIGELRCLTHLIIRNCDGLHVIPEGIGNLVDLEILSLRRSFCLSKLPESIRNLQKLTVLDIHYCCNLKELPEHIGELMSLKKLDMSVCPKLSKLPQSVSNLQPLEEVICNDWQAKHLWTPLLNSLKNVRITVWTSDLDWMAHGLK